MKEKIVVTELSEKNRIDSYLIDILQLTRSKIQKMIENGNILVNGKTVKNNYVVKINDVITTSEYKEDIDVNAEEIPLDIYYEDEDLLVINKPSGMVVHPANGHCSGTLVNALLAHNSLSSGSESFRPGIVHRIDKDTSGLLLVAKNDETHNYLADQIKNKKVTRKYVALVHGKIMNTTGTIDAPIGRSNVDRKKMAVTDENAKDAITHFKVLERYEDATLIECILDTGRTHQIRVHMSYIGYPIVNDPVYGRKKTINDYGQMLHAKTIGFIHPKTNEYLEFNAPVPKEFEEILNKFKI